jgi:mRNA interferase HigB
MRIIGRPVLEEFIDSLVGHKDRRAMEGALKAWHREVKKATRNTTSEVKRMYGKASIISADRVVFDIKGGRLWPSGGRGFREGHCCGQVDRHAFGIRRYRR